MKKILTFSILLLAFLKPLFAQQEPQYTLYMLNPFLINPAIAGTYDYYQIRTNHRFQWTGLKDAPVTNSISAFGPHSKKPLGFGGSIYNDITGPTSQTGINGVCAYNYQVSTEIKVSGGLQLGLMQYKVDGTKITTHDEVTDPVLGKEVYTSLLPDASFGVYAYATSFYGGISVQHLFYNKFHLSNTDTAGNRLRLHYNLIGGYRYDITGRGEWILEPCLILKKVVSTPYQFELNAKLIYNDMIWGGFSYRTQDAFSIVLGYTYQKRIFVGYSYDLSMNDLRKYSIGSHEVVIGYNFDALKKAKKKSGKNSKKR
ncbi:MAG: type IX secretion system membrane protein PorP/SprF [Bacteroidota bacterium]|nr:type IX secretion system membrane protein PorP/SprF [Bacteroidota bacterium]